MKRVGIMAALPQELGNLVEQMRQAGEVETVTLDARLYHVGRAHGVPVVATLARIGKVAAAATASALIHRFDIDVIVFTGVAGGMHADVHVGDVVIAETLLQHDLDASPLFPRYEVPLLDRARFDADRRLADVLAVAAESFIAEAGGTLESRFAVQTQSVHRGLIVSGDRFIASSEDVNALAMRCRMRSPSKWKAPRSRRSASNTACRARWCAPFPIPPMPPRPRRSSIF